MSDRTWCAASLIVALLMIAGVPHAVGTRAGESPNSRIDPAAIDGIFEAVDRPDSPGCVAAVGRGGEVAFEGAWGMANLELGVPLEPDSIFYAGSVSKQFTAASVALLALDGELSLGDDIRDWFPELRYERPIAVRHLVHHTSGVRDYFGLGRLAGWSERAYVSNEIVMDLLALQRTLNFDPGVRHLYSNSGYTLLAELVERASGEPLREFARERIFEPLDMDRSGFEVDYRTIVPGRASSYGREPDGSYHRYLKAYDGVGPGGLLTTAGDLLRWAANFDEPGVGGDELVDLMLTRGVLDDGEELDYAFGLVHGEYRGAPTVGHDGGLRGFRTAFRMFPEHGTDVVVLCNLASTSPADYAERIADVVLGEELEEVDGEVDDGGETGAASASDTEDADASSSDDTGDSGPDDTGDSGLDGADDPKAGAPPVTVSAELLDEYAGRYLADGGGLYVVSREGDRLELELGEETYPLEALSEVRFHVTALGLDLEFGRDDGGEVDRLLVDPDGRRTEATRVAPYDPSSTVLASYEGDYASAELGVTWYLRYREEDGALRLRVGTRDRGELMPLFEDVFGSALGKLTFLREGERIVGFEVDAGRVRGVRFDRR